MGLAWRYILDLAVFLITHSSSLPPAGADGCASFVWGNRWRVQVFVTFCIE